MSAEKRPRRLVGKAAERVYLRLVYESEYVLSAETRDACRRLGAYLYWQAMKGEIEEEYCGGW